MDFGTAWRVLGLRGTGEKEGTYSTPTALAGGGTASRGCRVALVLGFRDSGGKKVTPFAHRIASPPRAASGQLWNNLGGLGRAVLAWRMDWTPPCSP